MREGLLPKVGLAAVVLLAPGGFVLGAALAARWWRAQSASDQSTASPPVRP